MAWSKSHKSSSFPNSIPVTMFEIPFASEVTNLVNFLALDLLLLPYVMHVSGLLAGYTNHAILCKGRTLRLVVFDIPLVGGGIVMSRCWQRSFFILVRLSVVVAVSVCNFGLEGRSRLSFVTREATVRIPGKLTESFENIYYATERRMRCTDATENGDFKFGAVIDDHCYLDVMDHVYIQKVAFDATNITASATNCKPTVLCPQIATAYKCDGVDLVCGGTPKSSGCNVAIGVQFRSCVSVVYEDSRDYGWLCLEGWLMPGHVSAWAMCRGFHARREDVKDWVQHYLFATSDPLVALFGSVYGLEARRNVTLPQGERFVTVVQATWIVPMLWVVCVTLGLTFWWFLQHITGSHVIAHDERGLTKLLNKQIEGSTSDESEFEEPRGIVFLSKRANWRFWLKDPDRVTSDESMA